MKSSPPSAIRANRSALAACSAAADELAASRELIRVFEAELSARNDLISTERKANALLIELNASRKSEAEALRSALAAKADALAAKDAVIASQEKLIEGLKARRTSIWRRFGDILIGAGAVLILK